MRPLCISCRKHPVAINYYKGDKIFYRKKCDSCANNRNKGLPKWFLAGYRQKDFCEKCGHTDKYKEVFNVYHLDGNLDNCRPNNLKTVCANCQRILHRTGSKWQQGDLTPDF